MTHEELLKEAVKMGYFYIFTAVLCNTAKGYSSKRVSGTMQTIRESIVFKSQEALYAVFLHFCLFYLNECRTCFRLLRLKLLFV